MSGSSSSTKCIPAVKYCKVLDGSDRLMCLPAATCLNKLVMSADKMARISQPNKVTKSESVLDQLPTIQDIMTQTEKYL